MIKAAKYYFLIVIVLLCGSELLGQGLMPPVTAFETLMNQRYADNPLHHQNNPAFLLFDTSEELLTLQSTVDNSNGTFRRFIDPKRTTLYQQSASGKKAIDSLQVFQGSFGFQKLVRGDWNWIATKNYNSGSPYLLGDSTSGDTWYNGIVMQAAYSRQLLKPLVVGANVNYYVDEGLKDVSPKPTTKHRDMSMTLGAGYLFTDNLSIGVTTFLFDKNEKVSYREDKGSLVMETVLFKFHGYYYPQINYKKVETRYQYHEGIFSSATMTYFCPGRVWLLGHFGMGTEDIDVRDGALDPQPEGYWTNSQIDGGLQGLLSLGKSWEVGLKYQYTENDMWARHPEFDVMVMEKTIPEHFAVTGIEYHWPSCRLGLEGGMRLTQIDEQDYYSNVAYSVDATTYLATIGCDVKWTSWLETSLAYGFNQHDVNADNLAIGNASAMFKAYRINDIQYYLTDYISHGVNLKASINTAYYGRFNIYLKYTHFNPDNSTVFADSWRDDVHVSLEYQTKVF